MRGATARRAPALETVSVAVSEAAMEAYEAAIGAVCGTVGFFLDEESGIWTIEGVKTAGEGESELLAALALAEALTGEAAAFSRSPTPSDGWLARTYSGFPEQLVGRRFAVRGTHLEAARAPGRVTLTLDAGIAFGSGEHGSTRGCLRALERIAHRRPRNILDLGTGSGILAMAAAALLHQDVLASDLDPWAVRVTAENSRLNGLRPSVRALRSDGWTDPALRRAGPYDLVFANILARPLCAMAGELARNLRRGGTAILAGLLDTQARQVIVAHRRCGLVLEASLHEGRWTTLVLRRPAGRPHPE